ncbi:hypothetical protein [Nocardia sp. NPDC058666]|uniref:hypothetical protein n=1 Tax=unclassified Nocardia TaxID=2637762 RepID=UPI0036642FA7
MIVPVGCGVGAGFVVTDPPDDAVVDGAGTIVGWSVPEAGVMTVVVTLVVGVVLGRTELDPGACASPLPHPASTSVTPAITPIQDFPIMIYPSAAKAILLGYRPPRLRR